MPSVSPLCATPETLSEKRPGISCQAVTEETVRLFMDEFVEWVRLSGEPATERYLEDTLIMAIQGHTDSFDMASFVKGRGLPANDALIDLFRRLIKTRSKVIDMLTGRWVMKNNIRFPAKVGDIVFYHAIPKGMKTPLRYSGEVVVVDKNTASAVVKDRYDAKVKAIRILAEDVNTTSPGLFKRPPSDPPTPPTYA